MSKSDKKKMVSTVQGKDGFGVKLTTIPKHLCERFGLERGDSLLWAAAELPDGRAVIQCRKLDLGF